MESLFNSFIDLANSFQKVMPLEAIWMDKPIQTATEKTVRIREGHLIRIEKDEIKHVSQELKPTHKVIGCRGNIGNSVLLLDLENLNNQESLTLNLK